MMQPNIAVRVSNVSKVYDLQVNRSDRFSDELMGWMRSFWNPQPKRVAEPFWALKDINFELEQGEILGIIGRNGAGKSTLLKILSEVTKPTTGEILFNGRVASILEVGTGFHEELTGRENVYLNGALLGMEKEEIDECFAEIVAFSGIEQFIDTPVKHYSSGMFIRLAFSVVSHLNADILLLDEVFSVGDSAFSIKSFNRIQNLVDQGKSIILVSHNMGDIASICTKCLVLEKGEMKAFGSPMELIGTYIEDTLSGIVQEASNKEETESPEEASAMQEGLTYHKKWTRVEEAPGNEQIRVLEIKVSAKGKTVGEPIYMEDAIQIECIYHKAIAEPMIISVVLQYQLTIPVCSVTPYRTHHPNQITQGAGAGVYRARCSFPPNFFNRGIFSIDLFAINHNNELVFNGVKLLTFKLHFERNTQEAFIYDGNFTGPLFPIADWEVEKIEDSMRE